MTAAIPLFLIHEFYPPDYNALAPDTKPKWVPVARMEYSYDADGTIGLPPGPGLGVEVDEKLLAAEAAKPQSWKWPGQKLEDGSVSDY